MSNDGWRIEMGQVWKHKLLESTAVVTEVASVEMGKTGPEGCVTFVRVRCDHKVRRMEVGHFRRCYTFVRGVPRVRNRFARTPIEDT